MQIVMPMYYNANCFTCIFKLTKRVSSISYVLKLQNYAL